MLTHNYEKPEMPEPDGSMTIMMIGSEVEIDTYRASTMAEYRDACVEAATAPLLVRIAELEQANEAFAQRQEWWNKRMAEMEKELRAEQDRRRAEINARLSASPAAQPVNREVLVDLIAQHLSGTYHCLRVWEAWRVGTMTSDDFEDVGESDTPSELADEILQLIAAAPAAQPVAWVAKSTLASSIVSRERGGPYDVHMWSEGRTDFYSVPLYTAPAAQPVMNESLWPTFVKLADYLGIDPEKARLAKGAPSDVFISAIERKAAAPAAQPEPVAYLWQHSETGRTRVVMLDQVTTADANWTVVGPLYLGIKEQP